MNFLDELQKNTNRGRTENDAATNLSSLDPVLDFFSLAGAMRGRPAEAVELFQRAYAADPQAAVRTLFYLRDIRGGQGERDLFRAGLAWLDQYQGGALDKVLKLVPEYGRWDDLWGVLTDERIATLIKDQLARDEISMAKGESVSLLAKWLPSVNTSSSDSVKLGRRIARVLGFKESQYRKLVASLRRHIKLLEQQMSAAQWAEIDYSKLPSQAHRKHVKAFHRHDEGRYADFLAKAVKGEAKLNTNTLYTYEVFDAVQAGQNEAADAMWANLPDYTQGTRALVMADVSGSMSGRPMSVSVSLALYFAERNIGPFKDHFMTFSERPQLVKVLGKTLSQKLRNIESSAWGMNTNLEAAFDAILAAALSSKDGAEAMPSVLYIISDMEFDACVTRPDATLFENAQVKFEAAGLKLPHVVFWNVDARQTQAPATKFDDRVTLISGLSQSTFRYAVEGKSPLELMDEVINSERYAPIVL